MTTKPKLVETPAPLVIESGVPIPVPFTHGAAGPTLHALRDLYAAQIGDSLLVPCEHKHHRYTYLLAQIRRVSSDKWARTSRVEGGYRVWKVA